MSGTLPGNVDKEEYRRNFEKALAFLNGQTKGILQNLEEKMMAASAEMNFEEAAAYRDLIHSVKQVTERQKITSEDAEDRDIIARSRLQDEAVVQVFFIRGRKIDRTGTLLSHGSAGRGRQSCAWCFYQADVCRNAVHTAGIVDGRSTGRQ